jgi:hypothetical protein
MNPLLDALTTSLEDTSVGLERFQAIVLRLLDNGAVCHGDSRVESELYNDAVRVDELLAGYFEIAGCRLFHDRHYRYFRLFPPGADVPGLADQGEELPRALRQSLTQTEVAAALALRFLYGQAVYDGRIDEDGEVTARLSELYTAMETQLQRPLPLSLTERRALFATLRRLKAIRGIDEDALQNADALLVLRPTLTSLIHTEHLAAALEDE